MAIELEVKKPTINIILPSSGTDDNQKYLRMESGTITLSEDAQAPEITHNLGVIPDLVIVEAEDHDNTANSIFGFVAVRAGLLSCTQFGGTIFIINGKGVESNGAANINGKNAFDSGLSDTGFVCAYNSANYKYRAGWTYRWRVFAGLAQEDA